MRPMRASPASRVAVSKRFCKEDRKIASFSIYFYFGVSYCTIQYNCTIPASHKTHEEDDMTTMRDSDGLALPCSTVIRMKA